jgi:iduronate 2-sulfatase
MRFRRDWTLILPALLGPALSAGASERPNVLFIAVDDLRTELGCYGNAAVKSPNIDRLAAMGMRFDRAYCQQAICAPSRASLLTGCRPDTTRIYDLESPVHKVRPDIRTLPQHFKRNGYVTVSLGKIYHHGNDDPEGWTERPKAGRPLYANEETLKDTQRRRAEARQKGLTGSRAYNYAAGPSTECLDVPDSRYGDGSITDEALKQMRKHKDRPFFLAVGYYKPHLPFTAPKRYWNLYDPAKIELPNTTEPAGTPRIAFTNWGELRAYSDIPEKGDLNEAKTRHLIHGYRACVSFVDTQIGRLLDELDKQGLRKKTVIILWGDHGWKLGEYGDWCKHTNFELDTHVPLLLAAPGKSGGLTCDALVEYVDIYPTLSALCGLEIPAHCEGTSMAPLLTDPKRPWKRAAFSQYPRGRRMGYTLRSGPWRYTEWIDRKSGKVEARELYDHASTDLAHENLVDQPAHAGTVRKLAAMLKAGWKAARPPR